MNINVEARHSVAEGYLVIDDFLEPRVAEKLYKIFSENKEWERINQIRESHYSHVFRNDGLFTPDPNEVYSASFFRSKELEAGNNFKKIYFDSVIPSLEKVVGLKFSSSDIRCYSLGPGDHYRSHCDDYAGDIGLILYLNKKWKYDWGGLLHIVNEGEIKSVLPIFNRAVIIWHEKFKLHHSVSTVASYALEPRFTITSFNKIYTG